MGEVLGEAFEFGVSYEGSFIMPGMEDNLSAQTLYMNPLNPGMISWALGYVAEIAYGMPAPITPRTILTA